jgi:flagellar motility protein MotE (MotC chaperone)
MGSKYKWLTLIIVFVFSIALYAKTSTKKVEDKKVYSEKEFEEKLKKTINRQIDLIKKSSISELAKELSEKQLQLELRDIEMKKREELLVVQGSDFMNKVKKFERTKSGIMGCVEKNAKQMKSRITKVVDIIASMKPVKAAEVLAVQDAEISINILSRLEASKASKIFNLMDKEISARLQKQYLHMKK